MEGKTPESTWKAVLQSPTKPLPAAGDPPPPPPVKNKNDAYPARMPLRADEINLPRTYRPRSIDGGEYLCWDPPPAPAAKIRSHLLHVGNMKLLKRMCFIL